MKNIQRDASVVQSSSQVEGVDDRGEYILGLSDYHDSTHYRSALVLYINNCSCEHSVYTELKFC